MFKDLLNIKQYLTLLIFVKLLSKNILIQEWFKNIFAFLQNKKFYQKLNLSVCDVKFTV